MQIPPSSADRRARTAGAVNYACSPTNTRLPAWSLPEDTQRLSERVNGCRGEGKGRDDEGVNMDYISIFLKEWRTIEWTPLKAQAWIRTSVS